jgi:hypothetical protein
VVIMFHSSHLDFGLLLSIETLLVESPLMSPRRGGIDDSKI